MGNAEGFRAIYERWNNNGRGEQDEDKKREEPVTIYYAVNGFAVWKYYRHADKEKVAVLSTLAEAQDFIMAQDKSLAAREATDHWLIHFIDQFGTAHFQRWNVDRSKMSDCAKPTCGWGYTDKYIDWAKGQMLKSESWRPPFIVDGIYTDETWE